MKCSLISVTQKTNKMKVKNISILIALTVFLLISAPYKRCFADPTSLNHFHSQLNSYSVTIPDGWRQVPQTIVDEGVNKAISSDSKIKYICDVAFQSNSAERWFQTPYVMVQVIKLPRQIHEDEFERFIKEFTGIDLTDLVKENLSPEALNLLTDIATGKVYLDRDNRFFVYYLESNVANVGKVRGKRVGHFGCQKLIIVSFYDTVRNWSKSKFDRDLILKSFHFDPSMAYNDSYKKIGFWERRAMEALPIIVLVFIVAGISAACGYIGRKIRQHKDDKLKDEQKQ